MAHVQMTFGLPVDAIDLLAAGAGFPHYQATAYAVGIARARRMSNNLVYVGEQKTGLGHMPAEVGELILHHLVRVLQDSRAFGRPRFHAAAYECECMHMYSDGGSDYLSDCECGFDRLAHFEKQVGAEKILKRFLRAHDLCRVGQMQGPEGFFAHELLPVILAVPCYSAQRSGTRLDSNLEKDSGTSVDVIEQDALGDGHVFPTYLTLSNEAVDYVRRKGCKEHIASLVRRFNISPAVLPTRVAMSTSKKDVRRVLNAGSKEKTVQVEQQKGDARTKTATLQQIRKVRTLQEASWICVVSPQVLSVYGMLSLNTPLSETKSSFY